VTFGRALIGVIFACPKCSSLYVAMQEKRPDRIAGRFDCTNCGVMIMTGQVRLIIRSGASTPTPKRLLEVAIVPMCQSPKIVNDLVHAKGLPANDNLTLRRNQREVLSSKRPLAVVWLAFLGLLVGVLLLV
jgi:uncharacterized protein YbaR (Trm112 family)